MALRAKADELAADDHAQRPVTKKPRHLPLDASNDASMFLDLIRVLASALVVLGHAISFYRQYSLLDYPRFPYMQNFAVVLFFLISGFLISHTIRKGRTRPDYTFARYSIGRVARIYAGYVPALLFVVAVDFYMVKRALPYEYAGAFNVRTFVGNLFMLQDFPGGLVQRAVGQPVTSFGSARPFWTLAVEMWIYLFVGAAVLLRGAKGFSARQLAIVGALGVVPIANLFGGNGSGLFSCWLLGALAEYLLFTDVLAPIKSSVLALLMLATAAIYGATIWRYRLVYNSTSYVFLFVAFTCVMAICFRSSFWTSKRRIRGLISYLAGYSFTLYLVHYTVLVLCLGIDRSRSVVAMWTAIAAANVVAIGLAHLAERRYRELGRWLEKKLLSA